jgi:cytochrome P450
VLLSEAAAHRDPEVFPRADEFVIDREPNRHLAFGVGIHRCPGSHLARVEFAEVVGAVLRRMPDYRIDPAGIEEYPSWSMVGGWRHLPATFTPGPRVDPG